jgi:hypothetical protein
MVGLSSLQFRYPFRKYQRQILDEVETSEAAERKHHIVAPPGSGKTIVGLELIRRFDEPAVVFAPTATIQQQWCEEVGLFTEGPTGDLVSREPERIAPINIYTYQLISAPGESRELLRETALKMWLEDVDFEVPTPAVVKEGDLAPYRDLAYFTEPTQREMDYLNNVQRAFEAEISRFTGSEALQDWAARAVLGEEKDGKRLEEVLNARPGFSLAALRYLRHAGQPIPGDLLALPLEANEPPTLEDWAALLERYALDHLQTSPREEDHHELAKLRRTLRPFGLSLTERGVRSSRSPGDLVLALSDSKGEAACRILAAELEALGEGLRAVVVTDFESMSSGARPEEVLDRDAGGAGPGLAAQGRP